mmetsp:Transcript_15363/g.18693  ORF Transcript_15363/g.18693 Transcript_15363/m.18693 type:complete len:626 (+) Transcript_15363:349-2226(+)
MDDSSIHTEMSVMTISSNTTALSSSSRRTIFPTVDLNHPKYASPKRVASHSHERIHRNRRRTETSISCSSTCSVSSDTSSLLSDMLVQGTHQTSSPIRTAPSQQAYDMAHITTQHRVSSPKPTFAHLNLPPSSKKSKKTKNKNILSRIHNFSPTSSSSKSTTNRSNFKHHSHTSLPSSSPTPYYPVQVSSSLSSGTTSSVSTINDQPFSVRPSSAPEPNVSRMTSTNTILQSNVTSSSVATPTAPMNTISSQYYVTSTSAASTPTIPTITINPPPQSSSSPRSRSSRTKSPTKSSKSYTLEERLFHALHTSKINGPSIKEFKECWAFANVVQNYYKKEKIDLVLDVAGGHGALGALLLILLSSSKNSVVIDPAVLTTDGGGVQYAWSEFLNHKGKQDNSSMDDDDDDDDDDNDNHDDSHDDGGKKKLVYRHECLRTGLRDELHQAINVKKISSKKILVVACHACQHLSDETLEIACNYGVHVAVMPCCQKDLSGGSFKEFSKKMKMSVGTLMDVLAAGKVMSWTNGRNKGVKYQVKMKTIDEKITPQNRIILCKAKNRADVNKKEKETIRKAHEKLSKAYHRAHSNTSKQVGHYYDKVNSKVCVKSLGVGLLTGIVASMVLSKRK